MEGEKSVRVIWKGKERRIIGRKRKGMGKEIKGIGGREKKGVGEGKEMWRVKIGMEKES